MYSQNPPVIADEVTLQCMVRNEPKIKAPRRRRRRPLSRRAGPPPVPVSMPGMCDVDHTTDH